MHTPMANTYQRVEALEDHVAALHELMRNTLPGFLAVMLEHAKLLTYLDAAGVLTLAAFDAFEFEHPEACMCADCYCPACDYSDCPGPDA